LPSFYHTNFSSFANRINSLDILPGIGCLPSHKAIHPSAELTTYIRPSIIYKFIWIITLGEKLPPSYKYYSQV